MIIIIPNIWDNKIHIPVSTNQTTTVSQGTERRPHAGDVVVEGVDVAVHQGVVAADGNGLSQQGKGAEHVLADGLRRDDRTFQGR